MPVPKKDVIATLRELKQPTTLFGETDIDRYNRLMLCEDRHGDDVKVKGE